MQITVKDMRILARSLFDRAVERADPARALRAEFEAHPLPPVPGRSYVIAIGKAAPAMLRETLAHLTGPVDALAVANYENHCEIPGTTVLASGHPVPDENGAKAARQIAALLSQTRPEDRVIALISGGGSALVPAPAAGISLADKTRVNELLLASGLEINAMNLVRQQLSTLKGGGLLRHAAPAPVTAYILSDVIGDDLRAIASGPTVAPLGDRAGARALLEQAAIWSDCPASVRRHLQENDDMGVAALPKAQNQLIGSNRFSLEAMRQAAEAAGWRARIVTDALTGDVGDAARRICAALRDSTGPEALIFGGETTVTLRGTGRGGRNQELALRVAQTLTGQGEWTFLSGGTDGRDGPTDAAGGLVDPGTLDRIKAAGGDAEALLRNNDSYAALDLAGDLLMSGATGTNVADVQALLHRSSPH